MKKIVVGCDPDSEKSGIAVYFGDKLMRLESMTLMEVSCLLKGLPYPYDNHFEEVKVELHIENVNGISSNAFNTKSKDLLPVKLKKAEHVGKCKQVQIEIERMAENFNIKVVHHKVSKQWKDSKTGRAALERNTGWTGQSNEDTRSAAYFGFIGSRP